MAQIILKNSFYLKSKKLEKYNIYIVTVPTPVDKKNNPDLSLLKKHVKLLKKSKIKRFSNF